MALLAVRAMTRRDVEQALARLGYAIPQPTAGATAPDARDDERPFAAPEYWAPFVVVGRP
jgi:hypothetical protein